MRDKITLAKDTVSESDIKKLTDWLLQKPMPKLTKGDLTVSFEEKYAEAVGSKYSVFVNSGSSANLLLIYSLITEKRLKNKYAFDKEVKKEKVFRIDGALNKKELISIGTKYFEVFTKYLKMKKV